MKTKRLEEHAGKAVPACDRCGIFPGEHRWEPASRTAERGFGEIRFCERCVEAFRSFMAQGKNPAKLLKLAKQPQLKGGLGS